MKASDLFVRCLEEEGIEYIFGVPGEENADFMMSLDRLREHRVRADAPRAGRRLHGRGPRPPDGRAGRCASGPWGPAPRTW